MHQSAVGAELYLVDAGGREVDLAHCHPEYPVSLSRGDYEEGYAD